MDTKSRRAPVSHRRLRCRCELPGNICVVCPSWTGIAEMPPEVLRNVLAQRLILNPQDARESASLIA